VKVRLLWIPGGCHRNRAAETVSSLAHILSLEHHHQNYERCKRDHYIYQDCQHIFIPALWLRSMTFNFIILKYKENSIYFSGSKGGEKNQ